MIAPRRFPGASLRAGLADGLPIVLVAVVGHLLVLRGWWFHDDWVFLADAAGVQPRGDSLVRVASYQWYWSVFYPLFGLRAWAWAVTRLVLHAISSLLVARIGAHGGLDRHARILAGLLFAAWPVAVESLYWGTGAVELLGVGFALAAVERWLAGGPRARGAALVFAALAVLSKEAGLLLVVFFGATMVYERRARPLAVAGLVALAALAAWAAWLVARDFDTTADYAVDLRHVPRNFGVYGLWLVTPAPLLRDAALGSTAALAAGLAVWAAWAAVAWRELRRRRPLALACLGMALLAVAPATVLGDHAVPRYLYGPAAALALAVAGVAFRGRGPRRATLVLATLLLAALAWSGTAYVKDGQHSGGRPIHRLAFKESISRYARYQFAQAAILPHDRVLILRGDDTDDGQWTVLRDALMDDLAVRLLCGPDVRVTWATEPSPGDVGAVAFTTSRVSLVYLGVVKPRR